VLSLIRDTDALETVHANGRAVQAGLAQVIERTGIAYVFTGVPAMFGIMFTDTLPDDYRGWANTDHELYDAVAVGMHSRGAMPEPDSREPWFMCEAHTGPDIVDRVCSAFEGALGAALDARTTRTPVASPSTS